MVRPLVGARADGVACDGVGVKGNRRHRNGGRLPEQPDYRKKGEASSYTPHDFLKIAYTATAEA
jgi:hypothetical protein